MNSILFTKDGSCTFYSDKFEESYHSTNGAISESQHVFIKNGVNYFSSYKSLSIFEFGFGTGLNCLLTHLDTKNKIVDYHSIEKYPLSPHQYQQFKLTLESTYHNSYETIIKSKWNKKEHINSSFYLTKYHDCIHSFNTESRFDVIFFDAFSPRKQPDLWEELILKKMYTLLKNKGILVTYCAKGDVKRLLKKIGFKCETLVGPPGKKEMVRGLKGL